MRDGNCLNQDLQDLRIGRIGDMREIESSLIHFIFFIDQWDTRPGCRPGSLLLYITGVHENAMGPAICRNNAGKPFGDFVNWKTQNLFKWKHKLPAPG